MLACLPLILLISGTLLVIVSVVITGFVISKVEERILKLEAEVQSANKNLTGAHEAIQRSYHHFSSSEIRLLIIQASEKKINYEPALQEIFRGFIQGLLQRYSAAYGVGPSDSLFREWESLAVQSKNGNVVAASKLSETSNQLISEWADRHKKIVDERAAKETKIKNLKMRTANYRSWSISLQIIGLIMVLCKDAITL